MLDDSIDEPELGIVEDDATMLFDDTEFGEVAGMGLDDDHDSDTFSFDWQ